MTVIQPPGVQWVVISLPEFNLKKQISWAFNVDDRSESSSTYDMIIVIPTEIFLEN
jgi:hypothetical protein